MPSRSSKTDARRHAGTMSAPKEQEMVERVEPTAVTPAIVDPIPLAPVAVVVPPGAALCGNQIQAPRATGLLDGVAVLAT